MSDPLDDWGNTAFDTRTHVDVPSPRGTVTVDRVPGDTDSQTRWLAVVETTVNVVLKRRGHPLARWFRSKDWQDHGEFSYRGDGEVARHLAEDSRVGGVLRRWRSFELRVERTQVLLKVPTGNVDASEAREGVEVVTATRQLLGA